ncbi:hypothetical protein D3C79_1074890 [compost metagenome]
MNTGETIERLVPVVHKTHDQGKDVMAHQLGAWHRCLNYRVNSVTNAGAYGINQQSTVIHTQIVLEEIVKT